MKKTISGFPFRGIVDSKKVLLDLINITNDVKKSEKDPKNPKNIKKLIKGKIKDDNNNGKFNFGKILGIWKNNNYDLSENAKKILDNPEDEKIVQNYFNTVISNMIIKTPEIDDKKSEHYKFSGKTYNPFLILLEYLSQIGKIDKIESSDLYNAFIEYYRFDPKWLNERRKGEKNGTNSKRNDKYKYELINPFIHLLKNTSYFTLEKGGSGKKLTLKINDSTNIENLKLECNDKFHNWPIQKFKTDIKNTTEESIYLTTGFSADRFDPSQIKSSTENNTNQDFRQKIYYGAPGTGKSYKLDQDKKIDPETTLRITFHPSYSYSNFVGVYKPIKTEENKNKMIFDFIHGPLINILIKAYEEQERNHLLIIEEINRANVSEVFGDFFQLIERNEKQESQYGISVSEDLKTYLNEKHKELNLEVDDLKFPSNLYIWATMNSSDQGTFPLDTAFKRRWNFEYIGIDDNKDNVNILFKLPADKESTDWNDFRESINEILLDINSTINEDKLLGPFFIGGNLNGNDAEDNTEIIKNKVVPYLYEDVLKYLGREAINKIFNSKLKNLSQIISEFDKEKEKNNKKDKKNPKIAKFTDIFSDELNKKINSIKAQKK